MSHHPPMRAVAEAAGVSVGTVSNYLNTPSVVAPATRERVQAAIDSLGYIRDSAARDLRRRGSDGIGLIVPDILNRLFVDIARGAQIAAGGQGVSLLMANAVYTFESFDPPVTSDQQDRYLDFFAEARMRGILYAAMSDPTEGIRRIHSHVRPIVVINYDQPGDWCSVLMDNEQAGRTAASHVASLGIRRICYLSPPDAAQPIADRRRGLTDVAQRLGLQVHEESTDGIWIGDGIEATRRILDREPQDERFAIVGVSDDLAIGALSVLRQTGRLRVPHDVAVMGLDGTHVGAHSDWISLTSISLPGRRMGEEAVRLVLDEAQPGHRHRRVVLPVTLNPGDSTGGTT